MSEYNEIPVTIDGEKMSLALGFCGIALFRHEPDKDYLDIWREIGSDDDLSEEHHWLFGQRELCIYLGGVALTNTDRKILHLAERNDGKFTEHSGGWRPPVIVEDYASETETEMWIQTEMTDVEDFRGINGSWFE